MKNVDSFPKTLIDAYNFLSRWKDSTHRHSCSDLSNVGVNFATQGEKNNNEEHIINPEKGTTLAAKEKTTNKTKSKTIICYKCGEDGHLSPNCPNLNKKDDSSENEEQSMSGNQLLMQGIHDHLETYSLRIMEE
jgi:6-phosphogluconolactonase/glucosamine-6-phosphate isomerase/deaminase